LIDPPLYTLNIEAYALGVSEIGSSGRVILGLGTQKTSEHPKKRERPTRLLFPRSKTNVN